MEDLGEYKIKPFSKVRRILSEFNTIASQNPNVLGLVEVNVSKAKALIQQYDEKSGIKLSFTGWVIHCLGKAVEEHKKIHAYRKGKKKIIIYDNVHVNILVERPTKDGKIIPVSHVIRYANRKNVEEITREIRLVQNQEFMEREQLVERSQSSTKLFFLLPRFLGRQIIKKMLRNTDYFINRAGTVGITAIGMFGKEISGWAVPFATHTLNLAIGGIKKKPCITEGKSNICDILNLTLQINHNIVDGAPAARFVSRLVELIEAAYGLDFE